MEALALGTPIVALLYVLRHLIQARMILQAGTILRAYASKASEGNGGGGGIQHSEAPGPCPPSTLPRGSSAPVP